MPTRTTRSPTDRSPSRTASRMRRLVGSAMASSTAVSMATARAYVTAYICASVLTGACATSTTPASRQLIRQIALARARSVPVALAVLAPGPATRPALALFELFLGSADASFPRLLLLGILHPADELVAG